MALYLIVLSALAIGLVMGWAFNEIRNLTVRIRKLEEAQAKYLPYHTADEIENATAAINKIMFDLDYKNDMVNNALAHLQAARGNGRK